MALKVGKIIHWYVYNWIWLIQFLSDAACMSYPFAQKVETIYAKCKLTRMPSITNKYITGKHRQQDHQIDHWIKEWQTVHRSKQLKNSKERERDRQTENRRTGKQTKIQIYLTVRQTNGQK